MKRLDKFRIMLIVLANDEVKAVRYIKRVIYQKDGVSYARHPLHGKLAPVGQTNFGTYVMVSEFRKVRAPNQKNSK